jgi:hypothetical protein
MQRQWNDLCVRLGVQPKQFGGLLVVLVVATTVLVAKFSMTPGKATAGTPAAARQASTKAQPKPAAKGSAKAEVKPVKRTVVKADLVQVSDRDPFHLWMVPEPTPAPVAAAPAAPSSVASAPGVLPGLPLKAVVRGELAVFGDQTARVGDAVGLPDGTFAEIKAIGDRVVTVAWDGRTFDVRFGGSGPERRAPAAGGFR